MKRTARRSRPEQKGPAEAADEAAAPAVAGAGTSGTPADDRIIVPISQFRSELFKPVRPRDEGRLPLEAIRAQLHSDIEALKDRLGRAHAMLRDEIQFWERGLQENEWEGFEAARRRVSRLKGALGYNGSPQGMNRDKVEPKK